MSSAADATPPRGPAEGAGLGGRARGRPRSAEADLAIVRATLELLAEDGYRALTVERVRERAGVGKATIYRRWASKEELVKAAVSHMQLDLPSPDTGSLRRDFAALAGANLAAAKDTGAAWLMPRLMSESADEPELHEIFYANLVEPRRRAVRSMLERARDRGEVHDEADLDLLVDVLVGPIVYRLIISGGDTEGLEKMSARVLEMVLAGVGPWSA
jgi:AcrR family transcriptional regulator